jgi:hypothetical protein
MVKRRDTAILKENATYALLYAPNWINKLFLRWSLTQHSLTGYSVWQMVISASLPQFNSPREVKVLATSGKL